MKNGTNKDKAWLRTFVRDWISAGERLNKMSPNQELNEALQKIKDLKL